MKIAQVVCTFPPYKGGIGNSAFYFSKISSKQGHDVVVFTPRYRSDLESVEIKNGFKIVRLKPWFKFGNAAILPQLLWKLKDFDIVHFHYPFFGSAEIIALLKIILRKKVKLVLHYHMDSLAEGVKGLIFRLYRFTILPILLRQAKIITCASLDYIKHSQIAYFYKTHQEKFRQTLFGVDLKNFRPVDHNREMTEEIKEKTILFVGGLDRAHYFKGLENLLKAVATIKEKLTFRVKLNIIGDGEMKSYYQDLALKLNIKSLVNLTGSIDNNQLIAYYNNCDVMVLPSINQGEAFGLVLLEAMACAKPVVASNLPGVRSVFKNGKHGLLVEPNNVEDLVDKLKIILDDASLARKMGQAGREFVLRKYTWDEVGRRLDEIYNYVKYSPK